MSSHTERDLPSSIGPTDVSPLTRVDTRSLSDRTFSEPARVPNRAATHIGGADLVGRDDDETTPAVVGRVTASEDQAVFGMADTVSKDGPSDSSEDLAPDPDPVADATMAKILSSHSTTRLGKKSSSRENAAAVREDPDAANAGVKPGCHPDRGFGIDPEVGGAVLGSRINQPGYKTTNQKDTQTSPGAKTNANSLESTPPGGGWFFAPASAVRDFRARVFPQLHAPKRRRRQAPDKAKKDVFLLRLRQRPTTRLVSEKGDQLHQSVRRVHKQKTRRNGVRGGRFSSRAPRPRATPGRARDVPRQGRW